MSLKWIRFLGAGFQLLIQTDNDPGIYVDAAARDAYFATPNGILDLARMDANEFLIIKLLDDGAGNVAYQQRVGGQFLDVTSLIQGETGPAGATGNSFFFKDEAARDAFFIVSPGLLETGLPVTVNENGTVTTFIWTGPDAPGAYDAELFRPASLGTAPGSLSLGLKGYEISSGGRVLDHKDAYGDNAITVLSRHDGAGSETPKTYELGPVDAVAYANLFVQTLADPQQILFVPDRDKLVETFTFRPAIAGELRFQAFAGTLDTGPVLIDKTFTIAVGQINTFVTLVTDNQLLMFKGDNVLLKLSGITMRGDLQTTGVYTGQIVPAFFTNEHFALETEVAVFGADRDLRFQDLSTQNTAAIKNGFAFQSSTLVAGNTENLDASTINPSGFWFSKGGSILHVLTLNSGIHEYSLVVPYNITTLTFVTSVPIAQGNTHIGLWLSQDGTKMLLGSNIDATVYEFDLTTPFDITTIVFTGNSLNFTAQTIDLRDIAVRPDGKALFIFSGINLVFEYDLPNALSLKNNSYSGNSTAISAAAVGGTFSPDGAHMYSQGFTDETVDQYNLGVPWDITTSLFDQSSDAFGISNARSILWNPEGTKAFFIDRNTQIMHELLGGLIIPGKVIGLPPESPVITFEDGSTQNIAANGNLDRGRIPTLNFNQTFDASSQDLELNDMCFSGDGSRMFLVGNDNDSVYAYNLSPPFDVASATLVGTKSLVGSTSLPTGFAIKPDGLEFYIVSTSPVEIIQFTMTTPWDVTTATETGTTSISAQDSFPFGSFFKPDGLSFYTIGAVNSRVLRYDLTTAWVISTASFSGDFFPFVSVYRSCKFRSDGKIMYLGGATDIIDDYELTTPWDITTAILKNSETFLTSGLTGIRGFCISDYNHKMFAIDSPTSEIYEFDVGIKTLGKILGIDKAFGSMFEANPAGTPLLNASVFIGWTTATAGPNDGSGVTFVENATADRLLVGPNAGGSYRASLSASFDNAGNNETTASLFLNNVEVPNIQGTEEAPNNSKASVSSQGFLDLVSGDFIDLRFKSTANDTVDIFNASVTLERVSAET